MNKTIKIAIGEKLLDMLAWFDEVTVPYKRQGKQNLKDLHMCRIYTEVFVG